MKKIRVEILFLLMFFTLWGSFAGAAEEPYRRLTDAKAAFECDIPAGWSEMQFKNLWFWKGPVSDAGYRATLSVKYYQNGVDDYASARDYIANLSGSAQPSKGAAAPPVQITPVRVANMDGSRFEVDEKFMQEDMPRRKSPRRPLRHWGRIPVRHAHVVLPVNDGFWALRFSAEIEEFMQYRPHFERLLTSFTPKGVPKRQSNGME